MFGIGIYQCSNIKRDINHKRRNSMSHQAQIDRIAAKIPLAKAKDKKKKVFGADSHKYKIKKPLGLTEVKDFEEKHHIKLPDGYKMMITQLGNEGKSHSDSFVDKSFAGPSYGIFPLESNNDALAHDPLEYLQKPFTLKYTSDEQWSDIVAAIPEENDAYDRAIGELFSGILPIGSLGCSGIVGLILNGETAGRVVYINQDLYKPIFIDKYFLDWYERWLDEIIQSDEFLDSLLLRLSTDDEKRIIKALDSLMKFKKIKNLDAIIPLIHHKNMQITDQALSLLTKQNYEKASPFLLAFIQSSDDEKALIACQIIFSHYKKKKQLKQWVELLLARLERTKSEDLLRFGLYILADAKAEISALLHQLISSDNEEFRSTAYYNIGLLKDNSAFDTVIKKGLQVEVEELSISALHAIGSLNNHSYIPYYKAILKRIPNDTYVISNVIGLLQKLGVETFDEEIQDFLKEYFDSIENDDEFELSNALIDFNRIPLPKLLEHATHHDDKDIGREAAKLLKKINKNKS